MRRFFILFLSLFFLPFSSHAQQQKLVKILVTSPHIGTDNHRPVADVLAGCMIRELNRKGSLEIIDREKSEEYLKNTKRPEWVNTRELAVEVGKAMGADVVIYSSLGKNYDTFVYSIAFIEVEKNLIQRIVQNSFPESASPQLIGRRVKDDMIKFMQYIPLPSELADPGSIVRMDTINPDELPNTAEIELPKMDSHGIVEQLFMYYRVFPGELEYRKLEMESMATQLPMDLDKNDEELVKTFTRLENIGKFALRYNFQAYLIQDCSTRALNVLIANKIPVLFSLDGQNICMMDGYTGLRSDGACYFKTNYNDAFESLSLTHRELMTMLIVLPKPGKKGGISKEYLSAAIARYHNDWDKTPTLVEVSHGFLDIMTSGMEN
ncbi:MAG: hypothetical protein WCU00_14200 [Candidatus Latescibacterota bacterium]